MFLAALGQRDAEVAASGPRTIDAVNLRQVRRQAVGATWKAAVTGVVLTLLASAFLATAR